MTETYRAADGEEYPVPQQHQCHDGWMGEDHEGRPVPCPRCRPHLRRHRGDVLTGWTSTRRPHQHQRPDGDQP